MNRYAYHPIDDAPGPSLEPEGNIGQDVATLLFRARTDHLMALAIANDSARRGEDDITRATKTFVHFCGACVRENSYYRQATGRWIRSALLGSYDAPRDMGGA